MKAFCQIREDGTIAQRAFTPDDAPFLGAVEVPENVVRDVMDYPDCFVYQDGQFLQVKPFPVIPQPISDRERINQLEEQLRVTQAAIDMLLGV